MMYHSWSFAKEGTCSITGTDGSYIYDNNYLSSGDVYALKIMYEPDRSSVYVKLRKELIEEESWSMFGPTWEDWYYVERNWLEFYSDSRCTNRISSPEAITQVEIQYTIGWDNGYNVPITVQEMLYIPPGTLKYVIGETINDGESYFGNNEYRTLTSYDFPRIIIR